MHDLVDGILCDLKYTQVNINKVTSLENLTFNLPKI